MAYNLGKKIMEENKENLMGYFYLDSKREFAIRVSELAHKSEMSIAEFCRQVGMAPATLTYNSNKIKKSLANKIIKRFPEISLQWLVKGKGEMLTEHPIPQPSQSSSEVKKPIPFTKREVAMKGSISIFALGQLISELIYNNGFEVDDVDLIDFLKLVKKND